MTTGKKTLVLKGLMRGRIVDYLECKNKSPLMKKKGDLLLVHVTKKLATKIMGGAGDTVVRFKH